MNICTMKLSMRQRYYQGGDISFLPKLDCSEITDNYAMTVQKIDRGVLLYDILRRRQKIGAVVLYDVLDNLIELESKGLYHSDIRAWNIVIKDKAFLIDAGAITTKTKTVTVKIHICHFTDYLIISYRNLH